MQEQAQKMNNFTVNVVLGEELLQYSNSNYQS